MISSAPWILCVGLLSATSVPSDDGGALSSQEEEEALMVDTVVVTGSRTEHRLSEAPVATEVITRADIESSGAETAADLLEEQSGVDLTRSFRGAGVRLQGLDAKHVLVLVDGERIAGRIDGAIDLERISVENIERIELVKGPSSALYGSDAMGGVINIITRGAARTREAQVHVSYGGLNSLDFSGRAGVRRDQWNTLFSAGWHQRDAYDLDPSDVATTGSGRDQWNVANRTEFAWDTNSKVTARADYLRRDQRGVDGNSVGAVFDRRNLTETLSASVGPAFRFADASRLRATASYSLFRDQFVLDQRGSGALDQSQETLEEISQLTVQYDRLWFSEHLVTVGLEGRYERLESERLENQVGDRLRAAVFLQDEWTALEEPVLVVAPGVRLDLDSQLGVHPTPKIAIRVDPAERLTVRASYGMGFRAPVFKELLLLFENPSVGYVVEGNPELEPETSQSVNLGAEFMPVDRLWLSVNVFRNEIDNLIFTEAIGDVVPGSPQRYVYVNIASAYTQGLETKARVRLARGFTLNAGYALLDSKDLETDRALEGRAEHRGTFDLRYTDSSVGFQGSVRGSVVGPRPFYSESEAPGGDVTTSAAEPYATVDLRIGQRLGDLTDDHLIVFAGVENVLDAGEPQFLPLQPRTFYGGLTGSI